MTKRLRIFGIDVDPLQMNEAVNKILSWTGQQEASCRFVVTPNVDHLVQLRENELLQKAYRDAALILADGAPLVFFSKLFHKPLPQRVAGSDLVPALFDSVTARAFSMQQPLRVFLLGAAPGVGQRAAENIAQRWPGVQVVGIYSPPLGFEKSEQENQLILNRIAQASPDVLLVGLGAPKQELWVWRHREKINARVALCVGATIDFLAGEKRRAPGWMRRLGLEWLHRVLTEPRRLARRYLHDAWVFPGILWREWRLG